MSEIVDAWPDHWRSQQGGIGCLVLGCEFATNGISKSEEYVQLLEHCKQQGSGGHKVLIAMLHQDICVHDGCSWKLDYMDRSTSLVRDLYDHEISTHSGATSMSRIESFIALVRKGRVNMPGLTETMKAIFARMVQHLGMMGNTSLLMFQRGGILDPAQQNLNNLILVLSPPFLRRPASVHTPYWEPISADLFLMNIAPGVYAPENDLWAVIWSRLRVMYAGGRM